MRRWQVDRASQITLITTAVLAGVVVGRLWLSAANGVIAVVAVVSFMGLRWRLGLVVTAALVFGIWRGATTATSATPLLADIGRNLTLTGTVSDDPGANVKNQTVCTLAAHEVDGRRTSGRVYLSVIGSQTLQRGYQIAASGKLRAGIGTVPVEIIYAKVQILSRRQNPLEQVRQRFFTALRAILPDPLSGFGLGLLIGVRALIEKPLQATLNAVGLSHLIAVSGYNLTIIIQAVRRLPLRLSAFAATAVSLWLIFGFMIVAGFGASIVRAAMVSSLSLGISYYGYEARPITLIALPALITVAWKPDYLLHDAGWQLSFLAFFGIMVLAPLLERRLVRRPTPLKLLVVESLAAQIMTAPLIMAAFGNLSLVSPLANAAILPLVPLAMLLSFTTGAAAIALPVLAGWVALPTAGLLGLMIGVIQWLATWPHANLQVRATVAMVAGMYALIATITLGLWRHGSRSPFDRETRSMYN